MEPIFLGSPDSSSPISRLNSKFTRGSLFAGIAGDQGFADNVVACLSSGGNSGGFRAEPGEHIVIQDVRGGTRDRIDSGQGIGIREGGPSYTLGAVEQHAVAYNTNYVRAAADADGVRDAARLSEGMDDSEENFPLLPKGLDSPRYRALGNAWTVQVGAWIAHRIAAFESGAAR